MLEDKLLNVAVWPFPKAAASIRAVATSVALVVPRRFYVLYGK